MISKEDAERIKAYITATFMGVATSHTEGGCETCGWGGDTTYGLELEDARGIIDSFLISEDNK